LRLALLIIAALFSGEWNGEAGGPHARGLTMRVESRGREKKKHGDCNERGRQVAPDFTVVIALIWQAGVPFQKVTFVT